MALHRCRPTSLLHQLRTPLASAGAAAPAGSRALSDAAAPPSSRLPADGRTLQDFVQSGQGAASQGAQPAPTSATAAAPAAANEPPQPAMDVAPQQQPERPQPGRTAFVETYGCQMNVNDSEVVAAVLSGVQGHGLPH